MPNIRASHHTLLDKKSVPPFCRSIHPAINRSAPQSKKRHSINPHPFFTTYLSSRPLDPFIPTASIHRVDHIPISGSILPLPFPPPDADTFFAPYVGLCACLQMPFSNLMQIDVDVDVDVPALDPLDGTGRGVIRSIDCSSFLLGRSHIRHDGCLFIHSFIYSFIQGTHSLNPLSYS